MTEFLILTGVLLVYIIIGMVIGLTLYYFDFESKNQAFVTMIMWPILIVIVPLFFLFAIFDAIAEKIEELKKK